MSSKRGLLLLALVAVAAVGILLARHYSRVAQPGDASSPPETEVATNDGPSLGPEGNAPTGDRSKAGGKTSEKTAAEKDDYKTDEPPMKHRSTIQPVKGDTNPQTRSVMEALKSGKHPERLSVLIPPKEPFDKAAFEADPKAYTDLVVPGRVFQCSQPGPNVPALKAASDLFVQTTLGATVKLKAQGAPLAPVTFTAMDLGAFEESKLSSVTVRADKDGVATATFMATPGAMNDVNILCGSPLASGQVKFKVVIDEDAGGPAGGKK